ncbi:MAG: phosphoglycerate dehydrogenase [Gammaproteobacteria bacterium]|nr:phosphoglycerate dehydrogenase [Gammaproteobacteria bacterium]MCP4881549.1 phosphoglycerate dehydrogenase [Gammaproteobacteria bacterium]
MSYSLNKDKIKIVLLEGVHQSAVQALQSDGYNNIHFYTTALPEDELIKVLADAHFVGIRSRTQLTRKVLENAPKLLAVGCFCIGTNQVDLMAALERGIPVFNAPYSNTRSVAELVIAQAVLLLRGVAEKNAKAHRGVWLKSAKNSYEMRGKVLGVVGYGSIGSQLGIMAESMGMNVIYYDAVTKLSLGNANPVSSLAELLGKADVVSLHVPETKATANLMGSKQFAQMKDGSILINASRGTVVDIDALAHSLSTGKLLGAAIDVFPVEPRSNDEEFVSPLREFDNVILTPHIGGSTVEAQENIGVEVADKLVRYCGNGTTLSSVNFPEVSLPNHENTHRLLHIHANVPGVLSQINSVFSENNINISGQYLNTNEKIGYVVIDIDASHSELALKKLKAVTGTLSCRILF